MIVHLEPEDIVCPDDGTTRGLTCIDEDDLPISRTCAQCGRTWVLYSHEPTSGCACFACRVVRAAGEGGVRTVTKEISW